MQFYRYVFFYPFFLDVDLIPGHSPRISVLDQNPLGSAAGFGINGLALDREETAKLMGFGAVQSNPM
jgi:argininosuccinate lyase